jgi:hypothetical protein
LLIRGLAHCTTVVSLMQSGVLVQYLSDTSPPFRDFYYNTEETPVVSGS